MYLKIFEEKKFPHRDILLAYRLLFQLLNYPDMNCNVKDDHEFWRRLVNFMKSECSTNLGGFILSLISQLDFSPENVCILSDMVGENSHKISPPYCSKLCSTTGFIIFFIKDALAHAGVIQDLKSPSPPARLYKNYMYMFNRLQAQVEKVKEILSRYSN